MRRALVLGVFAFIAACGGGSEVADSGARTDSGRGTSGDASTMLDAGIRLDATSADAAPGDATAQDSAAADAVPGDAPATDAPATDAAFADATPGDAPTTDAALADAAPDATALDGGAIPPTDAGVPTDTGLADAGMAPFDAGPIADAGPQSGAVAITEILVRTSTVEWIELHNTTAASVDLATFGFRIRSQGALGRIPIHAVTDRTGATPIPLAPGARAFGVPSPAANGAVPNGAAFVFGAPGQLGTNAFFDAGDVVDLESAAGLSDRLDFTNAAIDPAQPIGASAFPLVPGVPMELDTPSANLAIANDDGASWCANTFRPAGTPGAVNRGCGGLVINEAGIDAPGDRAAGLFIEIAGPAGAPLGGVTVGQPFGSGGGTLPSVDFALPSRRVPLDGYFVIGSGMSADYVALLSITAGPGALRLVRGGALLDAVGWGALVAGANAGGLPVFEGTPLPNIRAGDYPVVWARRTDAGDTNNNASDFRYDPSPTPGAPNGAPAFALTSVTPDDAIATRTATIVLRGNDFTDQMAISIGSVSPTRCTSAGTNALRCVVNDPAAGPRRVAIAASTRPEQGLSSMLPNALTWTVSLNESNTAAEADFANLQFPATETITAGGMTQLIFGRIYEGGLTNTTSGQVSSISAEVGYGPAGSNPTISNDWTWVPAMFNREYGNDDEYMARLTVPTAGTYAYTLRFSLDGGLSWTYADRGGAGTNAGLSFDPANLGTLTVNP